jgi:hypothetical protein
MPFLRFFYNFSISTKGVAHALFLCFFPCEKIRLHFRSLSYANFYPIFCVWNGFLEKKRKSGKKLAPNSSSKMLKNLKSGKCGKDKWDLQIKIMGDDDDPKPKKPIRSMKVKDSDIRDERPNIQGMRPVIYSAWENGRLTPS